MDQPQYPSDINAYFKDLVEKAWEKANKRQKVKAQKEASKNVGLENVLNQLKKKESQYLKFISFVNRAGPGAGAIVGLMKAGDQKKVQDDDRVPQDDADHSQDEKDSNKLEDVRQSNFAYSQTKVAEFISAFFAMLGVGCSIVSSELQTYHNDMDANKDHIITMIAICNISTIFLSNYLYCLNLIVLSILGSYLLYIRWLKSKLVLSQMDTLWNTGQWKPMVIEIGLSLVMNYPSLYNETYIETANDFSNGYTFYSNDLLLCFMMFCRIHFVLRALLQLSFYTDPRAQRVCTIYGCDANNSFALKALMINNSWIVLIYSMAISLLMFSYQLRLFEKQLQQNFRHITTSMWNILITMTTVGYGDLYAQSHCGRAIAIICAFWGVFLVSLFVVSLQNMLNFDPSQAKAFNLLQRLLAKDELRDKAAGMLAAAFRIKLLRRQQNPDPQRIKMVQRQYRNCMQDFQKISRQIRNQSNSDAEMENLQSSIMNLVTEVELIKQSQFFVYKNTQRIRKRLARRVVPAKRAGTRKV